MPTDCASDFPSHSGDLERLLHELRRADSDLMSCLLSQGEAAQLSRPDLLRMTRARWLLSRARRVRRLLVEEAGDKLESLISASEREELIKLRVQHREVLLISSELVAKWDCRAMSRDWGQYRLQSTAVRNGWLALIEAEARLLYPLLARYAGLPAPLYPPPKAKVDQRLGYAAAA